MLDIKKWFGRWDALHLLYDASIEATVNEACLQHQCIVAWERFGGSCFIHYTTYIAPNYKIIFFGEREKHTYAYMLQPIPLSAIQTKFVAIRLSSHSLRCEMGHWGSDKKAHRLCSKQVCESQTHTLLECSAYDHIRNFFPCTFSLEQLAAGCLTPMEIRPKRYSA